MDESLMSLMGKRCARWLDIFAIVTVFGYVIVALQAEIGTRLGIALDPVWTAAQQRGELRVATDLGWRPFADLQDGQVVGYDIDLAREIGHRLGMRVTFIPTGFDALYDALTTNQADMIASALPYAPERGEQARFSDFYFNAGQVLVVQVGSVISTSVDLKGHRTGAALGSDADALAHRMLVHGGDFSLENTYDTPEQVLLQLANGSLDAAIVDNVAALAAIQHYSNLHILTPALTLEPYVLAVPPQAFQLQAEVNRILKQLQDEGFFDQLNKRWLR